MTVGLVLLVAVLVASAVSSFGLESRVRWQRVAVLVNVATLALLGLLAVITGSVTGQADVPARILLVELFVAAVLGGSAVTSTVLWLVDRGSSRPNRMDDAGEVLRGGAWIGAFERSAVFVTLAAGWPEGLAIVLALKGLGRYSELRGAPASAIGAEAAPPTGGVAERFIIGTFASVLWASACAGIYLALTG